MKIDSLEMIVTMIEKIKNQTEKTQEKSANLVPPREKIVQNTTKISINTLNFKIADDVIQYSKLKNNSSWNQAVVKL